MIRMNRSDDSLRDVVDRGGGVCGAAGDLTDYVSEDADKVPLQTHTLREFEQHLNDLKKENFSLKLRIYFLEERIQQKYEDSSDDVYRTNIELKVEVESLKQELQEKQKLLDKALTTAESLTNHNEADLQRRCEERRQEIHHMQQVLETKIQLLQEEAQLARNEAERVASRSQHPCVSMESVPMETSGDRSSQPVKLLCDADRDRQRIEELNAALCCKERLIREMTEERRVLRDRVQQMEDQLQLLSTSLLQKERDAEFYQEELSRERLRVQQEMESLIAEQQTQLQQYECAAGQCVSELQKAQLQVESLQSKIHESETSNKRMQQKIYEMEAELRSIRQAAQSQERNIQNLTDSVCSKETETQELYHVIEGQNNTLCKLREITLNQLQNTQGSEAAVESGSVLGLESSLFSCQLQLEAGQRVQRRTQRHVEDLTRTCSRLQTDLQDALQHRDTADTHNQDLRKAVQQLRCEMQLKDSQLRDQETHTQTEITHRDTTIRQLQHNLQEKHTLIQEYSELLDVPSDCSRDSLLDRLRIRIRERDGALERSIDEKFRCLEEKESEVRHLQLALREKDRDLQRLHSLLRNNEETITSLDALLRRKEMDLEQLQESCQKLQWLKQESEERHTLTLRERDSMISLLQTALHTHSKETEELRSVLLKQVSLSPADVLEELNARLSVKERQFQDVLSDSSRQTQEHHRQIDHLLDTISTRDQYIKDYGDRLRQIVSERTAELQELRRQLSAHDHEPTEVIRERETQRERELENLQSLLKEKEKFIQELLTSRPKEEAQAGVSDDHLELQAVREELQLAVRKQRESERELSELHSVLTRGQQGVCCTDQQSVLQQLVSEQQKLNEALRTERSIYQNLNHINRQREKSASVIDAELDAVRTLRGQLEEVLLKSREMALALGRAALVQADYGESSTDDEDDEEDDEEDNESSSEEFTDSIEDDEGKLTAKSLTATRSGVFETCEEVQRRETHETEQQLVQAAHSSLSQIRKTSSGRHVENSELNQNRTGSESGSELDCGVRAGDVMAGECGETGERPKARRLPQRDFQMLQEEEEEEYDDDEDGDEREGVCVSQGKRGPPCVKMRERRWKRRCTRPHSLDLGALLSHRPAADDLDLEREIEGDSGGSSSGGGGGAISFWQHVEAGLREQAGRLRGDLAFSRQESRELQERLMVSEATVHAQAEQLKEYRELLSEAAVQRVSKQVQVDLQDLGYETSGRSENEAERDDASSPEFEVEMSTSLSCKDCGRLGDRCWGCRGDCDGGQVDDSSLKALVQDLRAQLTRCHRVIRSLQLRVRSLSTTSDYSSSLERTPRKVNWALQASAAVEEDEGWQSDGPVFDPLRPSRELQDLLTRVTLLETHIKSAKTEGRSGAQEGRSGAEEGRGRAEEGRGRAEEGRSATWPAKYNTLIQAQARELSYLRQKMREGRGICHILTQHLSDTTKAFEELLRANDIDYYMSQSFREQLSQSTALAQRLSSKISGRDGSELQDDKAGHELLALRLRKELQQKDHIIRSLHTKMQQRLDTPSSSHAPSETTDQSDRSSIVSEERVSTNEDVDLCSDVDAASEYTQEEAPPKDRERPSSLPAPPCCQPGIARCGAQEGNSGFSLPHSLSSYQLTASCLNDSCSYGPVSHHATLQHQTAGRDRVSLMDDGAFWENMIQPIRGTGQSVAPTNIYIQSLDSVTQLNNEIRELKEENMTLQTKIQTSRDSMQEMEQLREAVLSGCVRLKQAELEAEQWKEELRRLQTHSCEQSQQIQQLRQERQSSQEHANRLKHEVSLLQQQLSDSRQLLHSLQCELQLYDRVCGVEKSPPTGFVPEVSCPSVQLGELLVEVRAVRAQLERSVQENGSLRAQLQKQLDQSSELRPSPLIPASPLRDALYRRQILHDPSPSPPVRDVGPFSAGPPYSPYSELEDNSLNANDSLEPQEDLEGEAPDGSFANRNGRHAIGHVDDFSALQQQVLEGRGLVQRMEAELQSCLNTALLEALDYGTVKTLLSNSKTLRQILEEAVSLLKMFWRAALPSSDGPAHFIQREHVMQAEIHSLRLRMAEQEEVLQGTVQRLRSTSRTKENMETFIINQLSRTRDVLKKARANLEKNELRISSFSSSSSSLCHGQIFKGFPSERSQWGGMTHVHPGISTESVFLQPSKK